MLKKPLFAVLLISSLAACAQGPKSAFGSEPLDKLTQMYAEAYDRRKEIRLDGKKYRIYNNYVTFGVGKAYNSAWKQLLLATAADFNFHIRKTHFQLGGFLQGQNFYTRQQVQLHLAAGYRKESYQYFWAAYGGVSYSEGYYPLTLKTAGGKDTLTYPLMRVPGLHAAVQLFYKLRFDYGVGLTLFGDVNERQTTAGARVELFFSGAYRGTVVRKDED